MQFFDAATWLHRFVAGSRSITPPNTRRTSSRNAGGVSQCSDADDRSGARFAIAGQDAAPKEKPQPNACASIKTSTRSISMEKVAVRKLGERLIRRVTRASEAIYTAWEPSIEDGTHDTTDDVDGVRFGRVDSRRFAGRLVGDITADV